MGFLALFRPQPQTPIVSTILPVGIVNPDIEGLLFNLLINSLLIPACINIYNNKSVIFADSTDKFKTFLHFIISSVNK